MAESMGFLVRSAFLFVLSLVALIWVQVAWDGNAGFVLLLSACPALLGLLVAQFRKHLLRRGLVGSASVLLCNFSIVVLIFASAIPLVRKIFFP